MSTKWPDKLRKPSQAEIGELLTGFWWQLSELRVPIAHGENLLCAEKIVDVRAIVTEMMLAANGIARPENTQNLNTYLSRRQRSVLQRTMLLRVPTSSAWVGQAVALIVIYRWYAPQLADAYSVTYPEALEQETLHALSEALPNWPRSISSN